MIDGPNNFSDLEHTVVYVDHNQFLHCERHEWRWHGKLHSFEDHPSQKVLDKNGNVVSENWHKNGLRHRDEEIGPSIAKYNDGVYAYHKMGLLHRKNGIAMRTPQSEKYYYLGNLHREDGPAIIYYETNTMCWAWHGQQYDNFQEWGENSEVDPQMFVLLKLTYG